MITNDESESARSASLSVLHDDTLQIKRVGAESLTSTTFPYGEKAYPETIQQHTTEENEQT